MNTDLVTDTKQTTALEGLAVEIGRREEMHARTPDYNVTFLFKQFFKQLLKLKQIFKQLLKLKQIFKQILSTTKLSLQGSKTKQKHLLLHQWPWQQGGDDAWTKCCDALRDSDGLFWCR